MLYCLDFTFVALQWRSQNAENIMDIKGRLLYQAMILYNYVPFQMGTLKGKNLLPSGGKFFPLRAVSYSMKKHF